MISRDTSKNGGKRLATAALALAVAAGTLAGCTDPYWLWLYADDDQHTWANAMSGCLDGYVVAGKVSPTWADGNDEDGWAMKVDHGGVAQWGRRYGWEDSHDQFTSMTVTSLWGDAVLAGRSEGPGSSGSTDGWVLEVDSEGEVVQSRFFGWATTDYYMDITPTSDGGFAVAGGSGGDLWVLKLDGGLNRVWERRFDRGGADRGNAIIEVVDPGEPDGVALLVTAHSDSGAAAGGNDFWVLKLHGDGSVKWQRIYGGPKSDRDPVAAQLLNAEGDPDGFLVAGVTKNATVSSFDNALVLRIADDGALIWANTYWGDYGYQEGEVYSIAYISADYYLLGGWTHTPESGDAWLLGIDGDGQRLWSRVYGGYSGVESMGEVRSVGRALSGLHAAGWSLSFNPEQDAFAMRTDLDGRIPGCSLIRNRPAEVLPVPIGEDTTAYTTDDSLSNQIVFKASSKEVLGKDSKLCPLDCLVHVDDSSEAASPDGESWETAFTSVKEGIAQAEEDLPDSSAGYCEVWVAQGTYNVYETSAADTVQMVEHVNVYGGFEDGLDDDYFDERDWEEYETTLTGEQEANPENRVYHVVSAADSSLLDGFFVEEGLAVGAEPDDRGGGVLSLGVSPAVRNCKIRQCYAEMGGAGAYFEGGAPLIDRVTFVGNGLYETLEETYITSAGGGAVNYDTSAVYRFCVFDQNIAENYGGGVANSLTDSAVEVPSILDTVFSSNIAAAGSAVVNWNATGTTDGPLFVNDLFYGNIAYGYDGEWDGTILNLSDDGGAVVRIAHCTLADNTGDIVTGGVQNVQSSPLIANSIFWNTLLAGQEEIANDASSSPDVSYCDVQGGYAGVGNIDSPPMFDEPGFILLPGSPCIDSGIDLTSYWGLDAEYVDHDIRPLGRPVPLGGEYDMGCYERQLVEED